MITKQDKKKDRLVKELNELLESDIFEEEINLYYIPKEYTIDKEDKIILSIDDDSIFYGISLEGMYLDNHINPYLFISNTLNILNDVITNKEAYIFRDEAICKVIKGLEEASFIEAIEDVEMKRTLTPIKETLDNVLSTISLPSRSNKEGFYDTSRLDAIKQLINESDSPYRVINETSNTLMFGKKVPNKNEKSILMSSHADIVQGITNVKSESKDGWYHGTYDNLGTNASICTLMLMDKNLPDNIYFAFNAEEETGRCTGATDAFNYIKKNTMNDPLCIALDVTDEGFDEDRIISLEGLSAGTKEKDKIKNALMRIEGENISTAIVKSFPKDYTPFDKDYITCDTTVFDEGIHYGRLNANAFSFCVPTDGYMHSNLGLDIKESTYLGYIYTLDTFLHSYTNTIDKCMITNNINEIKDIRDYLVDKTERTIKKPYFQANYPSYTSPKYFSNPNYQLDNDEEEYDFDGYDEYISDYEDDGFLLDDDGNFILDENGDIDYNEYIDGLEDFAFAYGDFESFKEDVDECYNEEFPEDILQFAFDNSRGMFEDDNDYNEDDIER